MKGKITIVDVFSGIPLDFSYGNQCKELELGLSLLNKVEKKSLCIYDRLYFSKALVSKHREVGNYFLCRLQRNACKKSSELFESNKRIDYTSIEDVDIRMIKIINPKTKKRCYLPQTYQEKNFQPRK